MSRQRIKAHDGYAALAFDPGGTTPASGANLVRLAFGDVASGRSRASAVVAPSQLFVNQLLLFFVQYALSHQLWVPDSSSFLLPQRGAGGANVVSVLSRDGEPAITLDGAIGCWSPSERPATTSIGRAIVLPTVRKLSVESAALDEPGLIGAWIGDGRPLLTLGALGLVASGLFAWFLAVTGQLLPHDLAWLTISPAELRTVAAGRLVHFMQHDRAAFGGTLVAIGVLYLWVIRFPLAEHAPWAWWTMAGSAALGFLSFLSYLGTGYLDSWHGVATLVLLPLFGGGLWLTREARRRPTGSRAPDRPTLDSRAAVGRALLLLTGFGMLVAGLTIVTIGTFVVFVPQDLEYIGLDRAALDAIDPRLVPLIAHDRSGFGGGLATTGLVVLACVWFGRPSRALWEALLLGGVAGFGAAVGVHGLVGYLDLTHVGPAVVGAWIFAAGMLLVRPRMLEPRPLPV